MRASKRDKHVYTVHGFPSVNLAALSEVVDTTREAPYSSGTNLDRFNVMSIPTGSLCSIESCENLYRAS